MLWTEVFDFFTRHVFGGVDSLGDHYDSFIGESLEGGELFTSNAYVKVPFFDDEYIEGFSLSFGNYLSLISTIITMVVILVLCCALIKKIYNMCAHIIG